MTFKAKLTVLSLNLLISVCCYGESPAIRAGRLRCLEARGVFVVQDDDRMACFDPRLGVVNDQYSPLPGHYKPEKEDFDLLTQRPIRFFQIFREFGEMKVCNFSSSIVWVDGGSAMKLLTENRSPEEQLRLMTTPPGHCKSPSTHMMAIYPDLKTAQMALGICATPTGRPYYDTEKYEKDYFDSLADQPDELPQNQYVEPFGGEANTGFANK